MDKAMNKWGIFAKTLAFATGLAACITLALLFVYEGTILLKVLVLFTAAAALALCMLLRRIGREIDGLLTRAKPWPVKKDALTDVYDKDTSLTLIDQFLHMEGDEGVHGLLMLDIDGLAAINASRGTDYGDMVLMTTAEQIKQLFRKTDIIGRLGEDEFIIFLKNVESRIQLQSQAAVLLAALEAKTKSSSPYMTCGIGGALFPEDARDRATLLQKAEAALERAKKKGNNSFTLYNPKTDDVFAVDNFS